MGKVWWMEEINKTAYKKPKSTKMYYSKDGTPLGYLWQTHPDFDPFVEWRKGWKTKRTKAKPKNVKVLKKSFPDYGYGGDSYMGD